MTSKWENYTCEECDHEGSILVTYNEPVPTDSKYYQVMQKAYDRILLLYKQHVTELTRDESVRDLELVHTLEAQINILKYILGVE